MASYLLSCSIIYLLLALFAKQRFINKVSLVIQFFVGWLIIELAWLHALISAALIVMACGDFDHWHFSTLIGVVISLFNIRLFYELHQQGNDSQQIFESALSRELGSDYQSHILPERQKTLGLSPEFQWIKPFSFKSEQIESMGHIQYGPHERNVLSLFKPIHDAEKPRPVMLQIHGGGWVIGDKKEQGLPLCNKLVEAGWIFVAINYRLSPKNKFPDHLIDCKKAVAWIKDNIAQYGGDPNFIMTTGGSAGGHLCSLVALTANKEKSLLQPGFEDKDTRVQGCLPMYGVYDFADRQQHRSKHSMQGFLEKYVMPETLAENPALWDLASPVAQIEDGSVPFMVCHGELDTLSFVEDARNFVRQMKQDKPNNCCVYAELPTTQHAFDIFYSPHAIQAVDAMHHFAEYVYSQYLINQA